MRALAHRGIGAALRYAASGALQALGSDAAVAVGGGGGAAAAAAAATVEPRGGLSGLWTQASPGMPGMLLAGTGQGSGCGGSSGGSGPPDSCSVQQRRQYSRPASPLPDIDSEQLLQSLGLSDAASAPELLRNLRKLNGERQSGVLQHAASVAHHLCGPSVGLTQQQAGQLLEGCPELFSWEPEQRSALLFGELMATGLMAAEAAQCFLAYKSAAKTRGLAAGLSELAAILAHSQDRQGGSGPKPKVPAAERTVAALLQRSPGAVALVCQAPGYLRQRSEQLQQAGFSAAQVAALVWFRPAMFWTDSVAKLQQAAAVLAEELGLTPAEAADLIVRRKPSWVCLSAVTLRARAAALAQGFGKAQAAAIVLASAPALNCPPEVWRRNLHCMAACGVADPKAALLRCPALLHWDHAALGFVQRRLLLQRCFGLTAAQLYEGSAWCLHISTPAELAQRLQFIEHCGQQHRLASKAPAGRAAARLPPHERLLGLTAVVKAKQPAFLAAVGASEADWAAFQQQHPPAQCALYRWAQQAAEQEAERLRAALPAELQQMQRQLYMGK